MHGAVVVHHQIPAKLLAKIEHGVHQLSGVDNLGWVRLGSNKLEKPCTKILGVLLRTHLYSLNMRLSEIYLFKTDQFITFFIYAIRRTIIKSKCEFQWEILN